MENTARPRPEADGALVNSKSGKEDGSCFERIDKGSGRRRSGASSGKGAQSVRNKHLLPLGLVVGNSPESLCVVAPGGRPFLLFPLNNGGWGYAGVAGDSTWKSKFRHTLRNGSSLVGLSKLSTD